MYDIFRGEVAKVKQIRKLTNRDLAIMTGFAENTIAAFLCGSRCSDSVARALAQALDLEI